MTLGLAENEALPVAVVVDPDANPAEDEDDGALEESEVGGVGREVEGVGGVDRWHPHQAPPAEVVAGAIDL